MLTQHQVSLVKRVAIGTSLSLALLTAQVDIDAVFYRKLTIVPLNIVLYNVFSSKGPDLYGTEPWHFYLRNLALNFHLWLPLALSALPLLVIQMALDRCLLSKPGHELGIQGLHQGSPMYRGIRMVF